MNHRKHSSQRLNSTIQMLIAPNQTTSPAKGNLMKNFVWIALASGLSLAASNAQACTYRVDSAQISNELLQIGRAQFSKGLTSSSVKNFSYFESKPTPMCPEEMTYTATVTIEQETSNSICRGDVQVKKVDPWTDEDVVRYEVTGGNNLICAPKP